MRCGTPLTAALRLLAMVLATAAGNEVRQADGIASLFEAGPSFTWSSAQSSCWWRGMRLCRASELDSLELTGWVPVLSDPPKWLDGATKVSDARAWGNSTDPNPERSQSIACCQVDRGRFWRVRALDGSAGGQTPEDAWSVAYLKFFSSSVPDDAHAINGIPIASSSRSGAGAEMVMRNNTDAPWVPEHNAPNEWVGFGFLIPMQVRSFLVRGVSAERAPTEVVIELSNDKEVSNSSTWDEVSRVRRFDGRLQSHTIASCPAIGCVSAAVGAAANSDHPSEVFFFFGSSFKVLDTQTATVTRTLSPISSPDSPFKKLPPPFTLRIDAAVNMRADSDQVILFSGSEWIQLDLLSSNLIDGPHNLSTPATRTPEGFDSTSFENLPEEFKLHIDAAVSKDSTSDEVYLFAGGNCVLFNLVTGQLSKDVQNSLCSLIPREFGGRISAAFSSREDGGESTINLLQGVHGVRFEPSGHLLGSYNILKNPLMKALLLDGNTEATAQCPNNWIFGGTSGQGFGFFLNNEAHTVALPSGPVWQAKGRHITQYGFLSAPGEGYLQGQPCDTCKYMEDLSPMKTTLRVREWVIGASRQGALVLAREFENEDTTEMLTMVVLTTGGELWSRHKSLIIGEFSKYHPLPPGLGSITCNVTQTGAWLLGQTNHGHFVVSHSGVPMLALVDTGQIWTRGSGFLQTSAPIEGSSYPAPQQLDRALPDLTLKWPSIEFAKNALSPYLDKYRGFHNCEALWPLFPESVFIEWQNAPLALSSNSIVDQYEMCFGDFTWKLYAMSKDVSMSTRSSSENRREDGLWMKKYIVCVDVEQHSFTPINCCVKKTATLANTKDKDIAEIHMSLL